MRKSFSAQAYGPVGPALRWIRPFPTVIPTDVSTFERYRPLLALASAYLALGLVLRLVLWARFGVDAGVGAGALGWILPAGLAADAVQSLYLLGPLAVWLGLAPDRWHVRRGTRALLLGGSALWLFAMLFVFIIRRWLSRPLQDVIGLAEQYAAGDLRATLPATRQDEVGQLISAINGIGGGLQKIVLQVREAAGDIHLGTNALASGRLPADSPLVQTPARNLPPLEYRGQPQFYCPEVG